MMSTKNWLSVRHLANFGFHTFIVQYHLDRLPGILWPLQMSRHVHPLEPHPFYCKRSDQDLCLTYPCTRHSPLG